MKNEEDSNGKWFGLVVICFVIGVVLLKCFVIKEYPASQTQVGEVASQAAVATESTVVQQVAVQTNLSVATNKSFSVTGTVKSGFGDNK